ncbi:MAG: ABC transporter substrate-binding protein [Actinomycetota bacterium]|nr:ABC transporter substrate-binding protein [Actinomycetota bacterium]
MLRSARRRRKRSRARLAAVLFAVGALVALPSVAAAPALGASASKVKSWTFVVGNNVAVDSLNPYIGLTNVDYEAYGMIWDNLSDYAQTPDYSGTPRLATSWSVSKDQLTWTYHLRHGVRWSDGVPFTAADVVYSYQRDTVPGSTEYNNSANYVTNIDPKSIKEIDPYTVRMKVTQPTPQMAQLAIAVLPKHVWSHIPESKVSSYNPTTTVGTGPFVVSSFVPNQSITLKANPYYWGGKPGVKQVVFEPFANPSAEAFALQNGTIDFAENLTNQLWVSLKKKPGITLVPGEPDNFDELAFNAGAATVENKPIGDGNPALRDVKVRQAISWAVDPAVLIKKVFLGYALPGTSMIPPMYPKFYFRPPTSIAYHYDPAKAEQILNADGWKVGAGGIRVKNGKQLSLRLFIRSQSASNEQDGPYIKAWLENVGIKVTESLVADSQLTNAITNGNYDLFVWGWGVEPSPNFQLSTMTCAQRSYGKPGNLTAGWSDSYYCNQRYDQLFNQEQTLSGAARIRVVQAMQKQIYIDAPYRVLYFYDDVQAYRSDLFTGFAPQPSSLSPGAVPTGLLLFQPTAWWSYRCIRPIGTSSSLTDHNIGCQHTISATKAQLLAAGITGSPLSGSAIVLILGLLAVGGVAIWLLVERHDAANADGRE